MTIDEREPESAREPSGASPRAESDDRKGDRDDDRDGSEGSEGSEAAELDGSFDRTLRACILAVAISSAVLGFAALAFGGGRTALGVLTGGGIATLNLWALAKIASAFLSRRGPAPLWAILAFGKLLILVSGVYMLLKEGWVSGLHLAIGYAAMPIGITAGSLFARPPGDDEPSARATGGRG
jgi:hypothetical protein